MSGNDDWPDWLREAMPGTKRTTARSRPPRDKQSESPYYGYPQHEWLNITRRLIAEHPLPAPELAAAVLRSWDAIFRSTLGRGFHIGTHIFPAPQIMAFLLHALVPLELARDHTDWRADLTSEDKDLVYIPDATFSIEIKASSDPQSIFGNRSYGQEDTGVTKKAKDGYYLAINFERWPERGNPEAPRPKIRRIRFGWLDHTDWLAQSAPTGQQSSLPAVVENLQLLTIYAGELSQEPIPGTL